MPQNTNVLPLNYVDSTKGRDSNTALILYVTKFLMSIDPDLISAVVCIFLASDPI